MTKAMTKREIAAIERMRSSGDVICLGYSRSGTLVCWFEPSGRSLATSTFKKLGERGALDVISPAFFIGLNGQSYRLNTEYRDDCESTSGSTEPRGVDVPEVPDDLVAGREEV